MAGDVSWWGVAASLVLIGVTLAVSLKRRLGLERDVVEATVRAGVQLTAVGYALGVVLDPDAPLVAAWAWVAAMVIVAAATVARRAREVPGAFWLALAATTASTSVTLATVFGFGIFPHEARVVVPVGGMMIGNALSATVVAGRRIVAELADGRPEVEARLALGQPWTEASRSQQRRALRTAITEQVERTKAVGLVVLPGAMTGLILAGVDPVDAVKVQASIMFLILGAVATNVVVVAVGLTRRLFTPDHRLRPLRRQVV